MYESKMESAKTDIDSCCDSILAGNYSSESSKVTGNKECFVVDLNKNKPCQNVASLEASPERCAQILLSEPICSSSLDFPFVIQLDNVTDQTVAQDLMSNNVYDPDDNSNEQSQSVQGLEDCSQNGSVTTSDTLVTNDLPCEQVQINLVSSESSSSISSATSVDSIFSVCDPGMTDSVCTQKKIKDFHPIILDVRGSCADNIFDAPDDLDEPCFNDTSLSVKTSSYVGDEVVSSDKGILAKTQEALSNTVKSSLTHKSQSEAVEQEITYPDHSSLKTLLNLAKAKASSSEIGSSKGNSDISVMSTNSISQAHLSSSVNVSVSHNSTVVSGPPQKTSSNLNLSNLCFLVHTKPKSNKYAIKASCSAPKKPSSYLLINKKKPSLTDSQPLVIGESMFSQDKLPVSSSSVTTELNKLPVSTPSVTTELTPAERVQQFMDKVLVTLTISGKHLKNSDILKLTTSLESAKSSTDFVCSICRECFQEQDGLDGHYNRTSFKLVYDCSVCKKSFVFNNKCQLHVHVRNHHSKIYIQYSDIVSFMPYDCETNPVNAALDSGLRENASTCLTVENSFKRMICGIVSQGNLENTILKCSICSLLHCIQDKNYLSNQGIKKCTFCNVYLPSICAFKAHNRIHKIVPTNYVCPECGEINFNFNKNSTIETKRKLLFDHLDQCQHFNRVSEIECDCHETSTNDLQMLQHYMNKHVRTLYNCQMCVKKFSTLPEAIVHHTEIHSLKTARITSFLFCSLCNLFFNNSNILKNHAENHVRLMHHKAKIKWQWKCFLCTTICADRKELDNHCTSQHTHKTKRCTICFALFSSRKNLVDHILLKKCTFLPNTCFGQCIDVEKSPMSIDYTKYFKSEFVTLPTPTSSPAPSALVRIAPKGSSSSQTNNNKSKEGSANSLTISEKHHASVGNVNRSVQEVDTSNANQQEGISNVLVSLKNARTMADSVDHPMIVNKKLTFQNSSIDIQPATGRLISSSNSSSVLRSKDESSLNLYECKQCKVFIVGKSMYEKHLEKHIPNPLKRLKVTHNGLTAASSLNKPNKSPDLFLQCHQCRIVLIGQSRYDHHINNHIQRGDFKGPRNETNCVVCKNQVQNSLLMSHLKSHQAEGAIVCVRCQRTDFKTMEMAVNHANHFCGYTIMTGIEVNVQKGAIKRHAESIDRVENFAEKNKTIGSENVNGKKDASLFPCLLCGLAFVNLESRDEHISRLHDGIRVIYRCLKCQKKDLSKTFSKKESAVRHLVKKHRVVKKTSVEKFIKVEERNASSGQALPETQSSVSSPALPPKRLRLADIGDYMCGKCGFSCSASSEFSEHIQSHNTSKEPQCPECGLCFIVVSALKKHLFAVHKIKNVESYLRNKEISIVECDVEEPLIEVFPLPLPSKAECSSPVVVKRVANPLECTVCYKVFDNEPNLKTHMRNHGMAFIRSKRLKVD